MAVYWISYRIDGNGKGDERQYALVKAIHSHKRRYWDRTPNFVVFESGHTLDFLFDAFRSRIDPQRDLFLMGEIGAAGVRLYGANPDDDILAMLPQCRENVG
jgi:hypothetical protein